MTDKARIAVIGTGWWSTTAHIPTLKAHPDAELVALADIRPDVLSKAAEKYQVSKTYTDYREMLSRETLDGVVIAVWHAAHYEVARTCLEHDLHVVLEKPMTLLASHARDLTELARRRNRELIIGYPWHFSPHTLRAREVLQSKALGEIRFISCTFASYVIAFYRGDDQTYAPVFNYPVVGPGDVYSDPQRSGGGQGHLQVTHSAALVFFMTGLKPVTVLALMNNLDVQVDVVDAMIVRMDNGALASVGSTGILRGGDPENLNIQIYCDNGWVCLEYAAGTGRIRHPDQSDEILPQLRRGDELYPAHMPATNLVQVIRGEAANGSPAEVGWRTVELLDAAYRSAARDGQAVSVDSLYRTH
jgi:predicted dehydrogenase